MQTTGSAARQRIWLVLALTTLFVLVVNLAFWRLYRQTETMLEAEFARRLSAIAQLAASKIVIADADLISQSDKQWMHDRLIEVAQIDNTIDLYLISESHQTIATSTGESDSLSAIALLYRATIDSLFFDTVQTVVVTPLRQADNIWLRSAFAPVFDVIGIPAAVLAVDASIDYFSELADLQRRLTLASVISIGAGLALGVIFTLLQRRFLRTEQELGRARTHAQLGQMVAVVSHEIKNPLMIMRGAAERLNRKTELPEAKYLIEEVDRLNSIVTDYLNYARSGGPLLASQTPSAFDLIAHLTELRAQVSERFPDSPIEWTSWPQVSSVDMTGYPSALKQIFLNVIANAVEASRSANRPVRLALTVDAGTSVGITLTDQGPGIPTEQLAKLFEPFFTTKQSGSGLGLYLSRKIIDEMGGVMEIESVYGQGTSVKITLPSRSTLQPERS